MVSTDVKFNHDHLLNDSHMNMLVPDARYLGSGIQFSICQRIFYSNNISCVLLWRDCDMFSKRGYSVAICSLTRVYQWQNENQ